MNVENRKCHQRAVVQIIQHEDTKQEPLTRNKNTERKDINLRVFNSPELQDFQNYQNTFK